MRPQPPLARMVAPGLDDHEPAVVAPVAHGADDAVAALEQPGQRVLHEHLGAGGVHELVLAGADQLEAGAVADVGEALPAVRAEGALHDAAVVGAVEEPAPPLQLVDAVDDLVRVDLHHPPVVEQLAAEHGVGEVHLPAVVGVDVAEAGRDAALGHDRVRLAEQRLGHHDGAAAGLRRRHGGAHAGPAGADDQHVALVGDVALACHAQKPTCGSVNQPAWSMRMYTSAKSTEKRLTQAQTGWRDVERGQPAPGAVAGVAEARRRVAVEAAAGEVAQRMAAERVAGEQHDVDEQDRGPEPEAPAPVGRGC